MNNLHCLGIDLIENAHQETQYSEDTPEPLAFISSLAPEILLEIFFLALPVDESYTHLKTEAPSNVSQVSRSWRQLAISSSILWSRISMVLERHDAPYYDFSEERIRHLNRSMHAWNVWLERSKMRPLKITVRQRSHTYDDEERKTMGLRLEKTVENLQRWHDVEIEVPIYDFMALVAVFPSSLQRLTLMDAIIWPLSIVSAKMLSRLENIPGGKVVGETIIPCTNALYDAKPSISILDIPEDGAVFTSNIRYLSLREISVYAVQRTLVHFVMPMLLVIKIAGSILFDEDTPQIGIYSFIQRSGASLQSLDLTSLTIHFDELHNVLLSSPRLKYLRMEYCLDCRAQDIIDALTIQPQFPDMNILCPLLSTMIFQDWFIKTTKIADGLMGMVESRWNFGRSRDHTATLYAAFLNLRGDGSSRVSTEALARYVSEGLKVELTYSVSSKCIILRLADNIWQKTPY